MNWKHASLRALGWRVTLLGAVAGLWAALLYEGAVLLMAQWPLPWIGPFLPAVVLGLGLGALLAPIGSLVDRYPHRAAKAALLGALLGVAASGAGLLLLYAVVQLAGAERPQWVSWPTVPAVLALQGAAVGFASGMAGGRSKLALRRAGHGLLAGAVLGVPFAGGLFWFGDSAWQPLAGYALWGSVLAGWIFWGERRFARRWLRLVTGPGEDTLIPLTASLVTVGRLESNDVPLLHHREVFPLHCQLRREAGHYKIVDEEQGGLVLVNYRQVQEHALKPGDLLKIGSALLQYGEGR